MHVKRGWLLAATTVAGLMIAPQAVTATNVWYGGGTHDGYYGVRGGGAPDYPQVNNAVGATNVTAANAFLTGTLVATGGAPAKVVVYWAKADGGTDVAVWETADGGDSHEFGDFGEVELFTLLSLQITVDADSDYYYRFYAINEVGQTGWAYETAVFQTPAPPVVITGPGAFPGMTVAVLNGELTAGVSAEIEIHWGQAASGQTPDNTTTNNMGTITQDGTLEKPNPFEEKITGLSPGTGYAYRIWAENQYGDDETDWVWFSTFPEPLDFSPAHGQTGWYGGGPYDGYSFWTLEDSPLPGSGRGTLLYIR